MKFKIPGPLVTEHEELHEALVRATKPHAGGSVAGAGTPPRPRFIHRLCAGVTRTEVWPAPR